MISRKRTLSPCMELPEKISRLRAGRPYAELARAAQCSPQTIREIEAGRRPHPSYRIILKIARFFEVPGDWLADDAADWPAPEGELGRATRLVEQALSAAGLAGELSEAERRALAALRALPEEVLAETVGYLDGLADSYGRTAEARAEAAELKRRLADRLAEADAKHKAGSPPRRRAQGE